MANKKAKNFNLKKRADQLKKVIANVNNDAIQVTDDLVDASLASGAKWQKIMAKALKNSTVLLEKQQDMLVDTIAEVKGQYVKANRRINKLFSAETPQAAKPAVAKQKVKKVAKKVTEKAANAKSDVKKDDLRLINGVGPKIASLFNAAGISTFEQLAKTGMTELKGILIAAGPRFKSFDPKLWKAEAARLMKK